MEKNTENEIRLGNIYGFDGGNYAGNVYDRGGVAPTIRTFQGGNQQPLIVEQKVCVAMRGRPTDGNDYSGETEQRLEPNFTGNVNTLTGVQKDNLILETTISEAKIETDPYTLAYEDGEYFYFIKIRKLTPRECWRLMSFQDTDFDKAQEVNSNTQLYKQAGNSIVKNVLVAIIGQMFAGYEDKYKEGSN